MKNKILIYGAYGYTGLLILDECIKQQLPIIIAGRNETKLKEVSQKYNIEYRAFSIDNVNDIVNNLDNIHVVIHSAGPFQYTAKNMVLACLEAGTHYIDITGEIDVFEWIATKDSEAKAKNIMLLPGSGYDVVPSDCLASYLKSLLPDATHLSLAFYTTGRPSHGTMLTAIESMGKGGQIRKDGKLLSVPPAYKKMKINFGEETKLCVTIPWGDVSTAYYSTQIPNIEVYMAISKGMSFMLQGIKVTQNIIGTEPIQNFLKNRIPEGGPSSEERAKNIALLWGEVKNEKGICKKAGMKTPDGYDLTASSSVLIAKKILNNDYKSGFQTPSLAYGYNLALELPNVKRWDINE
ncbi:MAG: saccharopine dehydrogenase NADP-binding domain-containing protein [Candidatus Hydrogenedens sp.]|nr:saccharopine dehydrogenase NADP-binding domain-containing protein [Candidatus Hydrogenedens sp.]